MVSPPFFLLRLLVHLFSFALLPLVLRTVASLCIPPKRVWILLTILTSSHVRERSWTDVEPEKYSLDDLPVLKKLIRFFRHGSPLRENDGAIEFCRAKDNLHDHKKFCHHWFNQKWKSAMEEEDTRKHFVLCWFIRNNRVPPSSSRSFKTQFSWSLSLHDSVCTCVMSDVCSIYVPSSIRD